MLTSGNLAVEHGQLQYRLDTPVGRIEYYAEDLLLVLLDRFKDTCQLAFWLNVTKHNGISLASLLLNGERPSRETFQLVADLATFRR